MSHLQCQNISVLQVLNSIHPEGKGEPLCHSKTLPISRPHTSNIPTNRTEKEGEEKHLNLRGVVSPASCCPVPPNKHVQSSPTHGLQSVVEEVLKFSTVKYKYPGK